MDDIRQRILHEQEMQKAKLASHFGQAFSANGTVNEDWLKAPNELKKMLSKKFKK